MRAAFIALVLVGCGPSLPGESAGGTGGASTSGGMTTTDATTAVTTSAGSSSGASEPDLPEETCSWYRPENEGLRFCPAPSDVGTEVVGTTPFGPASFKFALFGLQGCASCPDPDAPALYLYSDVPQEDVESPSGDYIEIYMWYGEFSGMFGRIAGESIKGGVVTIEFTAMPTVEETSPPLDETTPPVLSGNLAIQGDGWSLEGPFAASLCSDLLWFISCE